MARRHAVNLRPPLPWRAHTSTVIRLSLSNYLRSGWIVLELALLVGAVALAPTVSQSSVGGGLQSFFGISGTLFIVEALIGAPLLGRRAFGPTAYMFLARLPSRRPYAAGVALAAVVLRIPLFLLLVALGYVLGKIVDPPIPWLVFGGLDVLLPACLVASIAIVLSPPVGTRITLAIFLVWILVIFRPARTTAGLPPGVDSALNALLVPLRPVTDSIFASSDAITARSSLPYIVLQTAYLVGIALLAGSLLERRSLDLH
jgi:hypothetical protein